MDKYHEFVYRIKISILTKDIYENFSKIKIIYFIKNFIYHNFSAI